MRYKQIADQFIQDIQQGRLPPNQRLPSLRQLATLHQISLTTALNCYHRLEELGWAIAKPQAGFYTSMPNTVPSPSISQSFTSIQTDPSAQQPIDGYTPMRSYPSPLGVSLLSNDLLPTEALQRSLRRAVKQQGDNIHLYPEPQGSTALRNALTHHFAEHHIHFSAADLVISNGCLDAIHTALDVTTKRGDTIAINSPCFSGLLDLLVQMDRKVIEIPTRTDGLDLEQLEQHMRQQDIQAALFSSSHMNPQGSSLSAQQKQQLAQLASRYQIPIIEDDVYLELSYSRQVPLPAKHWDQDGYVLWCGSVSKTLTAGYRLGWCLPGRYFGAYLQQRHKQSFGVSSPIQAGLAEFINTGQYKRHLNKARTALQVQVHAYRTLLIELLPPHAQVSNPQGGLVLWIKIDRLDSNKLLLDARDHQIDIRTGQHFSTLPYYQDCFRINAGWPLQDKDGKPTLAHQQLLALVQLIQQQLS